MKKSANQIVKDLNNWNNNQAAIRAALVNQFLDSLTIKK